MQKYKIADVVFAVEPIYGYVTRLCKNYEYDGEDKPVYEFKVTEKDIASERLLAPDFKDFYLESLAVFRKLCMYVLENEQGLIFHSSALMVDGKAYLFTAPSGTGKSTHARLWRELLGDKVVMINDDKPIIKYIDGDFYVYGTPWNGKHSLDTNTRAKISAICEINRGKVNKIEKIDKKYMFNVLLKQTLRSEKIETMDKLLLLLGKMLENINLFRLECNMDLEAAKVAYNAMVKGEINEN